VVRCWHGYLSGARYRLAYGPADATAARGAHRIFSRGVIGGGMGQWLGGTMASAAHEPISGVWGQSPWSGGEAPLKLKAFWSLDVQRSRQI